MTIISIISGYSSTPLLNPPEVDINIVVSPGFYLGVPRVLPGSKFIPSYDLVRAKTMRNK